jgi:hypothetical protein
MGVLFLILILALAVLGAIGMGMEIRFWLAQKTYLTKFDSTMRGSPDPSEWEAAFQVLGFRNPSHPMHAAMERILATESSPEEALDLVEMRKPHKRFFGGMRRYAIAVLLLCGIAGTLFSLQDALPASGIFAAFRGDGQVDSAKYAEAFGKLQPQLASAFLPSICGILATLLLQAGRYGLLMPVQQAVGRQFISVVCLWLIPWKLRNQEAVTAATSAASKFEAAAGIICDASSAAADMVDVAAKATADSLLSLGEALLPVAERMSVAVECLERAGSAMRATVDQFGKSLAANGPFIRAIEQLYDAISPAEARYERLLVSVGELQKLSTSQNVNLTQLYQKTASLAEGVLETAGGATRLADGMHSIVSGFPNLSQSVKDHESTLTDIASEWQKAASGLVSEFATFRDSIGKIENSHGKALEHLLQELPGAVGTAVAVRLPQEIQPLVKGVAASEKHIDHLQESLASLEDSVNALRSDLQSVAFVRGFKTAKTPQVALVRKKKWPWIRWPW